MQITKRAEQGARIAAMLLGLCACAAAQSGSSINITEYPTPSVTGFYSGITAGPDGALWFTENGAEKIGRITTAGMITEYPLGPGITPFDITAGPDGALWFTQYPSGNNIGRITTSGAITEYPVPTSGAGTNGIITGPDGALWFTEFNTNKIGRITTAGSITEYALPFGGNPAFIASGPDGALWFTLQNTSEIGRITTAGVATEFALSPSSGSHPYGITAGPDGALWFAEYGSSQIGRITTSGVIQQYHTKGTPYRITTGPDGALWFADGNANRIGRITTSGVITEYPLSSVNGNPNAVATGPDGNIWFVEEVGKVAHAPACGLGFSASFASGALTMNFDLGINTPADFKIVLHNSTGPFAEPLSQSIPAVVPPQAFSFTWSPFPNLGTITVVPFLQTAPGQGLCSEWTTVNTAI